jgi:hypothetical protein
MADMHWATEADLIPPERIAGILYRNEGVDQFLKRPSKHFLVASKGVGKTLLLKCKRYMLEQSEAPTPNVSPEDHTSTLFIPSGHPYLDLIPDIPTPTHEHLNFLRDWVKVKKVWALALYLSALSHFQHRTRCGIDYGWMKIDAKYEILSLCLSGRRNNPSATFVELLRLPIGSLQRLIDDYGNRVFQCFTEIHCGIRIFVDRMDQAMLNFDREAWTMVQAGLLEAAWDVERSNPHVKVYTAIRQEAYAGYDSSNKLAISGAVSTIRYSDKDLALLLDKLVRHYEGVNGYADFVARATVRNSFSMDNEPVFDYSYRHTLGRPRDFAMICDRLSVIKGSMTAETFKRAVNDAADAEIVANVFAEAKVLLNCLADKKQRARFMALLPTNIMTMEELKAVCRVFNENVDCGDDCKKCTGMHPFCDLFNIGLLGVVQEDRDGTGKPLQQFRRPHEMKTFAKGTLPQETPFYLVHSALHQHIEGFRNQRLGKKYDMVKFVTVGHGYEWLERHTILTDLQKVIPAISSSEVRQKIEDMLKDLGEGNAARVRDDLDKVRSFAEKAGGISVNITRALMLLDQLSRMMGG